MLSLPFLSAAWWAAKALGAKDAAARFLNPASAKALGVVVAGVVAIVAVLIGVQAIRNGGAAGAVAEWQAKLSTSRLVATLRERRLMREAEARAAAERDLLVTQIRETAEHAAALERSLAALAENPVCYPATIAKELRR